MRLGALDAALVIAYLAFLAAVALRRSPRRGGAAEYFLAGRRITLVPFVASLASSWYGGILGVGEYSFRYGLSNWLVFGVPYYLGAIVFGLFLARRAHESRFTTIPDALESAYGRAPAVAGAAILLVVTAPAAYVLMLGVLARLAFGWPLAVGVVAGSLFSTVYLFRGGLRADVITDLVQFVLMFLGFAILVTVLAAEHGTVAFWRTNLPPEHLTWNGGRPAGAVLVWYVIALSTLVEPSFYQRCFAARDAATARRGVLLAVPFWFAFDALTTSAGLYARALLPDLPDAVASYPALGAAVLPPGARGLFVLALLATIMSTVDTYTFLAAQTAGRDLYGRLKGRAAAEDAARWTRWGLVATCVLSIALALHFGSVIEIWHDLGSIATPALLVPVATALSRRWRLRPRWALAAMLAGGGVSFFWVMSGYVPALRGSSDYLGGIEPIYPGLAASIALFAAGRMLRPGGVAEETRVREG